MRLLICIILISSWLPLYANTVQHNGYQYQQLPVPDWVAPLSNEVTAPVTSAEAAGVSYLVVDEQLSLRQGQYLAYSHIAMQANSPQGLEQASEFQMHFAPDYQTLQLHFIRLTRAGQQQDITAAADIRLVQREGETDQKIYNGIVTAMVLLSDIQVGDRIDYGYTVSGTNPIYQGKRSAYFALNWGVPVQFARVRVLTDADTTLYHHSNQPQVNWQKREEAEGASYQWQQSQVAAVQDEGEYPAWYNPYSYLEISEFQNWQDVVAWALPLYEFDEPLAPELKKLADSWQAQAKSRQEYASLVVRYVQNQIRYFGIEIGLNSHQPYAPNLVFERKYGDCKDKTTLMLTLLRYGGIAAYPALVSSRRGGGITERLPNPGVFDHVITYMQLDGQDYWLDGTRSQQYGPLMQKGVQYFQQALLVKPGSAALTAMNAPQSEQNVFRTEETIALSAVGQPVSLTLQFLLKGESAESFRRMLDRKGITEYSLELEQLYRRQYPGADMQQQPVITDDKELNQLQLSAHFLVDDFWDPNSERQKLMLYGDSIDRYAQVPGTTRRQMPLAIEPGVQIEHLIRYKLAAAIDWQLDELNLRVENSAIKYQRDVTAEPMQISVLHQYQSKADHISAEQALPYVQQIRKVREALYYSVIIDKTLDEKEATRAPEPVLYKRFRELLNSTP